MDQAVGDRSAYVLSVIDQHQVFHHLITNSEGNTWRVNQVEQEAKQVIRRTFVAPGAAWVRRCGFAILIRPCFGLAEACVVSLSA